MAELITDEQGDPIGFVLTDEEQGDVIALSDGPAYAEYRCVPLADLRHVVALLDRAYSRDPGALSVEQGGAVGRLRRAVERS